MKPYVTTIPFCLPVHLSTCNDTVTQSLASRQLSGNGPFTRKCEAALQKQLGRTTRLVTSATHALETMALLLNLRPGDEVICPSFTFVSTANAFVLRGARLRFADNDEYGNILPSEVERLINPRTKAVIAVDYAGHSADIDSLLEICSRHNVPLLEDAAQALGSLYKERPLGTDSVLSCLSFHETKNIGCGEGGALVFGRDEFVSRAEIIREKGTNRTQFQQGLVDKYTWVDIGSSYVLSDLNAAYLLPQLEQFDAIQARRKELWLRYESELSSIFERCGISTLRAPAHNTPNFHIFALIFPEKRLRDGFIQSMRAMNVVTPFHYVSLHLSPYGKRLSEGPPERLAGCERLSDGLVRLPLFFNLADQDQAYVIDAAKHWLKDAFNR